MNNIKKKFSIILFLLIILLTNFSLANYQTVKMEVVEEPVCSITFTDKSGFEKKLISKDLNNKEVNIQLKVTNNEEPILPSGELVLLLDNSNSMNDAIGEKPKALDANSTDSNDTTRKDVVFNSAKTFLNNVMKDNDKLKISLVSFSSNTDYSKEGAETDAKLNVPMTNDITALLKGLESIEANGPRTNLDAGLKIANDQFTNTPNINKYLIVLTDGVPNLGIGVNNPYYSDKAISQTKARLQELDKNNVNVITMLAGINNPDKVTSDNGKTYQQIIDEIFGTPEKPTAGKFYYVTDKDIEKTILTDIYNGFKPIYKTLKNIKIIDYFPKEIVDNFEFSYVSKANIGNISTEIDKTNNSITWTIPELNPGEVANVQYKLKLKENFSPEIVDKIINTNQKVDVSYNDLNDKEQIKTSDVSPKLKLVEPPKELPKAGMTTMFIILSLVLITLSIYSIVKVNKSKY